MIRRWLWSVRFALAEIRHEWLFALGVAFAVCSVITTTSLLWGTRSGMIAGMRERLMNDPTVRELAAVENVSLPRKWFDDSRRDPRVDFLIPSVGRINLGGTVTTTSAQVRNLEVEYLPTAPEDPIGGGLHVSVSKSQPVPCIVSALVAEELGIVEGAILKTDVTRNDRSGIVRAPLKLSVDRVLGIQETKRRLVLLPLSVIEGIEIFKMGWAVPSLNWPRSDDIEDPSILDSLTLVFDEPVSMPRFGEDVSAMGISFTVVDGDASSLTSVRLDGGSDGLPFPLLKRLLLRHGDRISALHLHAKASANLNGNDITICTNEAAVSLEDFLRMDEPGGPSSGESSVQVTTSSGGASQLEVPLEKGESAGEWLIPARLAGILGAAKRRPFSYDDKIGEVVPSFEEYAGFRLYAKRLEDVAALRRELASQGIKVRTNEDRIDSVLALDTALGKFLAFIISAGALGGCGALFASIHLSVERSRRSFAVLQMMGIPSLYVVASSVIQAVLLVCAGSLFAFVLFQTGSHLLMAVFPGSGVNRVCVLSLGQWVFLLVVSLVFAVLATLPALRRTRSTDPAVIARGE